MSFLRLNGWPVKVEEGSARQERSIVAEDDVSERADPITRRQRPVLGWTMRTGPLVAKDADALEGLVSGNGHRFPFDASLFSTRGRGPLTTATASIVAGGVFGGFCASVTSLVYDLSRGPAPVLDQWGVMVFREEAGVFRHYVVRSDGAVFFEGARTFTVPVSSWLSVFDGFVTIVGSPTRFDELVILGFEPTDDQAITWARRMIDDKIPFSDLPRLVADGDLFGAREVEVIGSADRGQDHVGFSNGSAPPDGTLWRNNGRVVPFRLDQARAAPAADVAHPVVFLSMDADYFGVDMALPRASIGLVGPPANPSDGQVKEAAGFTGAESFTMVAVDRLDTDPLSISAAVLVDAVAPVGTKLAVMAKIDVGVTAGWWLNVTAQVDGTCDVEIALTNAAGTAGRKVSAIGAFRVGGWHHIVATYDGRADASGMFLYVDGSRVGAVTLNTAPGVTSNGATARVGRAQSGNGWVGRIDEAGFWTSAVSSGEARTLFKAAAQRRRSQWGGP